MPDASEVDRGGRRPPPPPPGRDRSLDYSIDPDFLDSLVRIEEEEEERLYQARRRRGDELHFEIRDSVQLIGNNCR